MRAATISIRTTTSWAAATRPMARWVRASSRRATRAPASWSPCPPSATSSADKNGGGDVAQTPNYLSVRFHQSPARKNAAFTLTPNTADAFVYQDEYVNFLNMTYPAAFGHATTPIFLEPRQRAGPLAAHARATARRCTNPATQAGLNVDLRRDRPAQHRLRRRRQGREPSALVFGPVNYGWQGMTSASRTHADANNRDFLEFYLAADGSGGGAGRPSPARCARRALVSGSARRLRANRRMAAASPMKTPTAAVARRAQAGAAQPLGSDLHRVQLDHGVLLGWRHPPDSASQGQDRLPTIRARSWRSPNTTTAAANHISGAIAQADALGIFGREGLFAANLWRLAANNNFIYGAFEMFRNYDGANGTFGNTSIRATNSNVANASVYASIECRQRRAHGRRRHQQGSDSAQTAGIAVTHTTQVQHRAGVHADQRQLGAGASERHQHHADERVPVLDAGEQRDHAGAAAVGDGGRRFHGPANESGRERSRNPGRPFAGRDVLTQKKAAPPGRRSISIASWFRSGRGRRHHHHRSCRAGRRARAPGLH